MFYPRWYSPTILASGLPSSSKDDTSLRTKVHLGFEWDIIFVLQFTNWIPILLIIQIDLFLQKCLANLFKLLTWRQKMTFWHPHFEVFSSEVLSQRDPADLPASDQFYCHYRPPERGWSPARPWSAVRCCVSQHSYQFLVTGHAECGGGQVPSWASNFFAPFWADSPNCSALLHICQILGEVSLHLVIGRSKLNGTQ
jgi:hypothetical protein